MLLKYLHKDISQYVFNLYIDYESNAPKLKKVINFKFNVKPHLYKEELYNIYPGYKTCNTYLDGILKKVKVYDLVGQKILEY